MAATSLCRQLQLSMLGWSIQTNRAPTARIAIKMASLVARVTDRVLTNRSSKVNRVRDPNENGPTPTRVDARLRHRHPIARPKRARAHSGRGRSGQADADF